MASTVRGRPAALADYTTTMLPHVRGVDCDVTAQQWALARYRTAPSDLPTAVQDLGPLVAAGLAELEQLDRVPEAFARALVALDHGCGLPGDSVAVDAGPLVEGAVVAALRDPLAGPDELRDAALVRGWDPAWARFTVDFVRDHATVVGLVDGTALLEQSRRIALASIRLAQVESVFDATRGNGMWVRAGRAVPIVDALDDAADAYDAALSSVRKVDLTDDLLMRLPGVGGGAAAASTKLGLLGVALTGVDVVNDVMAGRMVDAGVHGASLAASVVMMTPAGPVALGVAAGVVVGSIVYDNREWIADRGRDVAEWGGGAARAVGDAATGAAGAAAGAVGDAARAITDTVEGVWEW